MKKSGAGAVLALALLMITGLSVMYWKEVGDRLITASSSVKGTEMPICSVEKDTPEIAFTFDVSGGNENIRMILEILENQHIKATFFVNGEWAEKYPEEIRWILAAGHDLGNNGENHKQMSELSEKECRKEIMRLHEKVKKQTGHEMKLFRPPYGSYNNTVIKTAYACGYYPVCWNVDSLDWKDYGTEEIIKQVLENENLGKGSVILCHSSSKYICETLEKLIAALKEKGYTTVPVSELIYKEHYHMDSSGRQIKDKQ